MSETIRSCRATAHSNIALVKYWGKRAGVDAVLNLPAVGSLSMTLGQLRTQTTVGPARGEGDTFELDAEAIVGKPATKVFAHLDLIWRLGAKPGARPPCEVRSINHLPTAAGLASSASGFAALTVAAAGSFTLVETLDAGARTRLSAWARMGSGSAARSLWGGFVRLDAGTQPDGSDCRARPVFPADHWDLRLLVVHTARGAKKVGSTGGMEASRTTSPYYGAWVEHAAADLDAAELALRERSFVALGEVMEHSCFKMHACMLATRPPLMYWNGASLEVIHAVWGLRASGGPQGYVTSDAGPHIKVLCRAQESAQLAGSLREVPGVHEVEVVSPGPDASLEIL